MESKLILSIFEDNFDELTFESSIPVIAFFSANRCGVCKLLAPILEEIASDYNGKLKIYSINVDEHDSLATRFRLNGIPTLLIFKDGEVRERISGFQPKEVLENIINSTLNISV
jgi:thioredoxin 1